MEPVSGGRYCQGCQKDVIDFTQLSNQEIIGYFEQKSKVKTCGHFGEEQLYQLNKSLKQPPRTSLQPSLSTLVLGTLLTASSCQTSKTINHSNCKGHKSRYEIVDKSINKRDTASAEIIGTIISEDNEPLSDVFIQIGETNIGAVSDLDGEFKLVVPTDLRQAKVLTTNYVGFERLQINLDEVTNKKIKITLVDDPNLLTGEVVVVRPSFPKRIWQRIFR
ncbi:carboxypeptidase-like regulatory domain-containing protein [Haliscomenobacter sp.]|uniref:carboxypeptidase-like regulatory domain-containing protein n=1 Tax=Haliscomenobacter sp. TaxID=2717303 RepID=UPI003BAD2D7F